ncbi:hypothetical protein [Rhizobium wenxiniae]|uniref:hypothetical protein n=1 Tax=Rhizobium wenxiniae TaxID=1737357 RepID=UPI003C1B9C77
MSGKTTAQYEVKYEDFARRLHQATDANPQIPGLHNGRLRWFVEKMATKNVEVKPETVRRWFAGFNFPRRTYMVPLAEILKVDVGWLAGGSDTVATARQASAAVIATHGAINIVAGFIQLDGGSCAFPSPNDDAAKLKGVDLHAILRGAKYDLHIAVGSTVDGEVSFSVPFGATETILLGVVRKSDFEVLIYELDWQDVVDRGLRVGGSYQVALDPNKARKINNFTDRI